MFCVLYVCVCVCCGVVECECVLLWCVDEGGVMM